MGVMASPRSRLRWSISLGAAILVPGGLLAAWAVLRFGGTIEEQEVLERQRASSALEELGTSFQERLQTLRSQGPGVFPMAVDPDGRLGTPFVVPPGPESWQPPAKLGVALETARVFLAAGEPERALPFFSNGAGDDPPSLEPAAVLAMAWFLGEPFPNTLDRKLLPADYVLNAVAPSSFQGGVQIVCVQAKKGVSRRNGLDTVRSDSLVYQVLSLAG